MDGNSKFHSIYTWAAQTCGSGYIHQIINIPLSGLGGISKGRFYANHGYKKEESLLFCTKSRPNLNIRYFTRTQHFMDAYHFGFTGKAATYVEKKYHGHRVLPESVLDELNFEGQLELVS